MFVCVRYLVWFYRVIFIYCFHRFVTSFSGHTYSAMGSLFPIYFCLFSVCMAYPVSFVLFLATKFIFLFMYNHSLFTVRLLPNAKTGAMLLKVLAWAGQIVSSATVMVDLFSKPSAWTLTTMKKKILVICFMSHPPYILKVFLLWSKSISGLG